MTARESINKIFTDAIVIGGGHAGCEAALALARLKNDTVILVTNVDTIAFLACNPSIGGTAKGQIVREVDALGGEMAINADKSLLQLRMLNRGKGAAVHSPRSQVDKQKYHSQMKQTLLSTPRLSVRQAEAVDIVVSENGYEVTTAAGQIFCAKVVAVACGVYLNSRTVVGSCVSDLGPSGFSSARHLSGSLEKLGFSLRRFKTGTPARVLGSSMDFSVMEKQEGEKGLKLSFVTKDAFQEGICCYLTHTTSQTKKIILNNKHLAPIYSGGILGVGPRYCPSIEDKVVRFSDKETHQVFIEPEDATGGEWYVQGVSSSLPVDVQQQVYKSIKGLESVHIIRDAYAIEYDCIDATKLDLTLMSKQHRGLFFCGQICGTSGYEEAAAQGIVAGINADRIIKNLPPLILTRQSSYIGVLIDDITTKETFEPYRMMTSRAEYRLHLRQDNADERLTPLGRDAGLASDERWQIFKDKQKKLDKAREELKKVVSPQAAEAFLTNLSEPALNSGTSLETLLKRPAVTIAAIAKHFDVLEKCDDDILSRIEAEIKYSGYIAAAVQQLQMQRKLDERPLPQGFDYSSVKGLRIEAQQKLTKIQPLNIGQASRISGVSPADINVLLICFAKGKQK